MEKRSGIKYIPFMDADPDRIVVSMCEFRENLYCATQKGVYILRDDEFARVEMKEAKEEKLNPPATP